MKIARYLGDSDARNMQYKEQPKKRRKITIRLGGDIETEAKNEKAHIERIPIMLIVPSPDVVRQDK